MTQRLVRHHHIRLLRHAHRLGERHRRRVSRSGAEGRDRLAPRRRAARLRASRADRRARAVPHLPRRSGADRSARRAGSRLAAAIVEHSCRRSLPRWKPFADTNRALERLRAAGYRLGILSNVDDDLLAETRRHFTVDFDLIITAQQVGSYKPAPGHFVAARKRIGSARWLHAAQSNFHDVAPTHAPRNRERVDQPARTTVRWHRGRP